MPFFYFMKKRVRFMEFAKNHFIFQDIISFFVAKIPVILQHNLAKYKLLKKAFYLTAMENLEGDYYEFGVFTGSSFVAAMRFHRSMSSLGKINTVFFGFDSFKGFGKVTRDDEHGFYQNDTFKINKKKVLRWIHKRAKGCPYRIIEGYFDKTLKNKTCKSLTKRKIRIAFIDCDMNEPANLSLEFIKPGLQEGTILILDDFFSYRGNEKLGVAGAFNQFCKRNRQFRFRKLDNYGLNGVAYILSEIK